tara:strand:+ start:620 stop:901 length:282 start_codon:yes stop_codon:yes gene_type:complete
MLRPEHIEDALVQTHSGQWFGWSNSKDKVYANLIIHDDSKDKPTEEWLNAELSRLQAKWDVDQVAKDENLTSAKTKLENLGLTVEEIKEAFGI